MKQIATILRALQFYAHNAHNVAKGKSFFEDHEHFGELYAAYESAYDAVIERMIGLDQTPDLIKILEGACALVTKEPVTNEEAFETLMATEYALREEIDTANKGASLGTQNFLQGLADTSEQRCYLIGQRLKK